LTSSKYFNNLIFTLSNNTFSSQNSNNSSNENIQSDSSSPKSIPSTVSVPLRGERGPRGERGSKGDDGRHGIDGKKGERGDKGDRGDRGPRGEKGSKGDKGDKGLKGDKGERGYRGYKGDKGDKGNKGDRGYMGPPGPAPMTPDGKLKLSEIDAYNYRFTLNKKPILIASEERTKLTSYSNPKSSITIDKDINIKNNDNLIFTADGDNVTIGSTGNVKINGKIVNMKNVETESLKSSTLSIKGGRSKHNKSKNNTEFNNQSGRNQISGDTTIFGNVNFLGDLSVAKDRNIKIGNFTLKDKGTALVIMNNKGEELKTIPLKKGNETLNFGKFKMKEMKRGLAFLNENGEEIQRIGYSKKHKFNPEDIHLRDNMRRDNKLFSNADKLACVSYSGKPCGGKVKEWVDPQLSDARKFIKLDLKSNKLITHIVINRKIYMNDNTKNTKLKILATNETPKVEKFQNTKSTPRGGTYNTGRSVGYTHTGNVTFSYQFKSLSDEYVIPVNTIGRYVILEHPFITKGISVYTRKLYDEVLSIPLSYAQKIAKKKAELGISSSAKSSPKKSPKSTPKSTPKKSPKSSPKKSPKSSPKKSSKKSSRSERRKQREKALAESKKKFLAKKESMKKAMLKKVALKRKEINKIKAKRESLKKKMSAKLAAESAYLNPPSPKSNVFKSPESSPKFKAANQNQNMKDNKKKSPSNSVASSAQSSKASSSKSKVFNSPESSPKFKAANNNQNMKDNKKKSPSNSVASSVSTSKSKVFNSPESSPKFKPANNNNKKIITPKSTSEQLKQTEIELEKSERKIDQLERIMNKSMNIEKFEESAISQNLRKELKQIDNNITGIKTEISTERKRVEIALQTEKKKIALLKKKQEDLIKKELQQVAEKKKALDESLKQAAKKTNFGNVQRLEKIEQIKKQIKAQEKIEKKIKVEKEAVIAKNIINTKIKLVDLTRQYGIAKKNNNIAQIAKIEIAIKDNAQILEKDTKKSIMDKDMQIKELIKRIKDNTYYLMKNEEKQQKTPTEKTQMEIKFLKIDLKEDKQKLESLKAEMSKYNLTAKINTERYKLRNSIKKIQQQIREAPSQDVAKALKNALKVMVKKLDESTEASRTLDKITNIYDKIKILNHKLLVKSNLDKDLIKKEIIKHQAHINKLNTLYKLINIKTKLEDKYKKLNEKLNELINEDVENPKEIRKVKLEITNNLKNLREINKNYSYITRKLTYDENVEKLNRELKTIKSNETKQSIISKFNEKNKDRKSVV
jgi:hypothetical protein